MVGEADPQRDLLHLRHVHDELIRRGVAGRALELEPNQRGALAAAVFGAFAAASLGFATNASAVPLTGGPADAAVSALEAEGYTVRVNQSGSVSLSQCTVLGVNGLRGTEDGGVLRDPGRLNVATLDVNCPSHS